MDETAEGSSNRRSKRDKRPKTEIHPPANTYHYKKDPNSVYVEEEAEVYHNPPLPSNVGDGVPTNQLRGIPPPPDVPRSILPKSGHCRWTFEEATRVLNADFSVSQKLDVADEIFFYRMMERDDVTVISTGLFSKPGFKRTAALDPELWNSKYIGEILHREYHHKIRRFDIVDVEGRSKCVERDAMLSMTAMDYDQYVQKRERVLQGLDTEKAFRYVDHDNITKSFDVETTVLYIIDLDVTTMLPALYTNFKESVRLPGVLPGGAHCMMSAVCNDARPFMGPNLYVSPIIS